MKWANTGQFHSTVKGNSNKRLVGVTTNYTTCSSDFFAWSESPWGKVTSIRLQREIRKKMLLCISCWTSEMTATMLPCNNCEWSVILLILFCIWFILKFWITGNAFFVGVYTILTEWVPVVDILSSIFGIISFIYLLTYLSDITAGGDWY